MNKIKTATIIYNPAATGFNKNDLNCVATTLDKNNITPTLKESKYKGHLINLVKEYDKEENLIVTVGGDGTVSESFKAFNEIDQKGIYTHLPSGTTNDMATNLNINSKKINKIISDIINADISTIDSFKVNNVVSCYTAAFGYVSHIPYVTNNKLKKYLHHGAYVLTAIPEIIKKPIKYNITYKYDNKEVNTECIMGIISNSHGFGGINLYPNIDLNDSKIEMLLLHNLDPKIIPKLFKEYLNNEIDLTKYTNIATSISSDKFAIKFNNTFPTNPIDIDGENSNILPTYNDNEITFELGKKIKILKK